MISFFAPDSGNTPEQQQAFVAAEMAKWAEVAKVAKVSVD